MPVRIEEIASILKQQIEGFDTSVGSTSVGTVIEASDGIARIHGLGQCMASELVDFGDNVLGLACPARQAGIFPSFFPASDVAFPTVATRDVGRLAARCLVTPPARSIRRWQIPEASWSSPTRHRTDFVVQQIRLKPDSTNASPRGAQPSPRRRGSRASRGRRPEAPDEVPRAHVSLARQFLDA